MKIKFLKVKHGDSIHIRFQDDMKLYRNILIDGGPSQAYEYRKGNKKISGELKDLVSNIRQNKEYIDLLIMTHVDSDHIEGILTWFEKDENAHALIKKIWFNSGQLIYEYFRMKPLEENNLIINQRNDNKTGINQGVSFEKYITEKKIWDRELIHSGNEIPFYNTIFQIVSPNEKSLKKLLCKWDSEVPLKDTSARNNEYDRNLKDLINEEKSIINKGVDNCKNPKMKDTSIHNGSSIAFVFKYKDDNMLFLGDANPSIVVNGLETFGYNSENPLKAIFVKVPHHGSNKNLNNLLLETIISERFIICTDGSYYQHPDKRCCARIFSYNSRAIINFNYKERIELVISDIDKRENPNLKVEGLTEIEI